MMVERTRMFLAGIAAGLLISVFYLRGTTEADLLNQLRDGATLLVLGCVGLSVWQLRSARSVQGS